MDRIDRKILTALQAEGRMTNQALSDAVGLSPSPCLRRVRAMEESGLIEGYGAQIDRKAAGFPITAFVRIRLTDHARKTVETFEKTVQRIACVLQCHLTSGSEDYLLEVVARSQADYERFMREELHAVPGIAAIETSFAFGLVKRTTALPLADA